MPSRVARPGASARAAGQAVGDAPAGSRLCWELASRARGFGAESAKMQAVVSRLSGLSDEVQRRMLDALFAKKWIKGVDAALLLEHVLRIAMLTPADDQGLTNEFRFSIYEVHPYIHTDPRDQDMFYICVRKGDENGRPPDRGRCKWNQAGGPQTLKTAFGPAGPHTNRRVVYRTFLCSELEFSPKTRETRNAKDKAFEMRVYELHAASCPCCACGRPPSPQDPQDPVLECPFRLVMVFRPTPPPPTPGKENLAPPPSPPSAPRGPPPAARLAPTPAPRGSPSPPPGTAPPPEHDAADDAHSLAGTPVLLRSAPPPLLPAPAAAARGGGEAAPAEGLPLDATAADADADADALRTPPPSPKRPRLGGLPAAAAAEEEAAADARMAISSLLHG